MGFVFQPDGKTLRSEEPHNKKNRKSEKQQVRRLEDSKRRLDRGGGRLVVQPDEKTPSDEEPHDKKNRKTEDSKTPEEDSIEIRSGEREL